MISRSHVEVKVIGQGHQVKKRDFQGLNIVYLTCCIEVKGHYGQGQRSRDLGSQVKVVGQGQGHHVSKKLVFRYFTSYILYGT